MQDGYGLFFAELVAGFSFGEGEVWSDIEEKLHARQGEPCVQWRNQKILNTGARIRNTSRYGSVWFDSVWISVHVHETNKEGSKKKN